MPVTSITQDPEALTLTIVADFPVSVRRLWDAYADPRQLERFWGPPGWPATFTRHDMAVGGRSHYFMTGPDGDKAGGFWEFLAVEEGVCFEVRDGFADADGVANAEMPTMRMVMNFESTDTGSRLCTVTHFDSLEQLEQLVEMGMVEGTRLAMGQIDEVLADLASFAAGIGTQVQLLGENQARISRVIRGSVDQVWRAHHEPELLKRWQLGPDGWSMPVCEVGLAVGETYRYEWENDETGDRFGFSGVVKEINPPVRAVTTEAMIGMDGPVVVNELNLTPVEGGTLLTMVGNYPDAETREMILATGMADGMETSYARLEREILGVA
ncbi:SRPBCC family protein [Tessaracoccus caeni]|uniref:SRPBCC family protein n=1 Tax=Tessaracoccus caeni TaxID=3031239 RepID=UPI0023DAD487|nr:SRPBCC family protein [Tessaracoccus caeni]MDF1487979.1 SRPBCC family protein [Tessaracoccus caeni]